MKLLNLIIGICLFLSSSCNKYEVAKNNGYKVVEDRELTIYELNEHQESYVGKELEFTGYVAWLGKGVFSLPIFVKTEKGDLLESTVNIESFVYELYKYPNSRREFAYANIMIVIPQYYSVIPCLPPVVYYEASCRVKIKGLWARDGQNNYRYFLIVKDIKVL